MLIYRHQLTRKSTTKNNSQAEVRIPEFNEEDEEIQSCKTSPAVYPTNTETTATPRTKRRQQLVENSTSTVSANIENRRMRARNRMAAKRTEATPEEVK